MNQLRRSYTSIYLIGELGAPKKTVQQKLISIPKHKIRYDKDLSGAFELRELSMLVKDMDLPDEIKPVSAPC